MEIISIVVPVYNVESYLRRCLDSIIAQTYSYLEVLLIDDGSTDNSGKICDEYALKHNNFKVYHKQNEGQGIARNTGIELASGQYIGFVDADDWISADMYETLINLIKTSNADIADIAFTTLVKENDIRVEKKENIIILEDQQILHHYLAYGLRNRINNYSACTKLYRSSLIKQYSFSSISKAEDYLINFRILCQADRYAISNKVCYFYFQRNNSSMHGALKKSDFGGLENCQAVVDYAKRKCPSEIVDLALQQLYRFYFSLVLKGYISELDNDITHDDFSKLEKILMKQYKFLMQSYMPLNRKFIMTCLVINIKLKIIKPKRS